MTEKTLLIRCRKHNEKYDAMKGRCPKCVADVSAFEYMKERMTCQLCGEIKASTEIYCGGPVGQMCKRCSKILRKYWDLKKRFDEFHERRKYEYSSQIFFRKTFDNDPVESIWG